MTKAKAVQARRVAVSDPVPPETNYASAFEIATGDADAHSAEEWVRTTFEHAPRSLRWFVLLGWTTVLRLRLGPRPSPDHVLGWRIVATTPERITLEVRSTLIVARKVVDVRPATVAMTTFVHYERPLGRLLWSAVAPVHHRTEPLLLTSAARRTAAQRASRRNFGS